MNGKWLKRGMWLVLGALILSQALGMRSQEPETVTAVLYTPPDQDVSGICIFQAKTVWAPWAGNWTPVLSEGQRAAAGEVLFQWQPQGTLSAALSQETDRWNRADLLSRRAAIHQSIAALAQGDHHGAVILTAAVLAESGGTVAEETPRELPQVTADVTGIFSTAADGLDEILTPETPWAEWSLPQTVKNTALGRLITGDRWYFRTEALDLEPGEEVSALLLGGLGISVTMTVEAVTASGTLLSCTQGLSEVSLCRYLSVKIFSNEQTGLEIPAAAVYTVDGEIGVWCLVGETPRFKAVTIQKDLGDRVVVELDQSTTDNLWPGDQVLRNYQ
jgi:hypothetical protein